MTVFATDLYKPFRDLIRLLEGKTVGDLPSLLRARLSNAGFADDRPVLNIPLVQIIECMDEEAGLHRRDTSPLRGFLAALQKIDADLDAEATALRRRRGFE